MGMCFFNFKRLSLFFAKMLIVNLRFNFMRSRKFLLISSLIASLAVFSSGCAYRADLAQGNFVEQENINKLHYGMSAEQVRFILGTPMLVDPFDNSRWYYVHYFREGWDDPQIKNLIVLFNGATLVDISGDFEKPASFNEPSTDVSKISLDKILKASSSNAVNDSTETASEE